VLEREPEKQLLQACRDLGVTLVAHTPLEQGLLTDKYVAGGGDARAEKVRHRHDVAQHVQLCAEGALGKGLGADTRVGLGCAIRCGRS
jgi:aryl-alcohol dehydrogenase-like predicted oxidoreductase